MSFLRQEIFAYVDNITLVASDVSNMVAIESLQSLIDPKLGQSKVACP